MDRHDRIYYLLFNAVGKIVGNCFIWCKQLLDGL